VRRFTRPDPSWSPGNPLQGMAQPAPQPHHHRDSDATAAHPWSNSEHFRCWPRTCRPLRDTLSARRTNRTARAFVGTKRGEHAPMSDMIRREFIMLLGGAAAAWPLAARAQQPADQMRRVGMLMPYEAADPEAQARNAAIQRVLRELGWSEGRNVEYHFRWAGNDIARLRASAAELVGLRPDVILAPSTIATEALRQA